MGGKPRPPRVVFPNRYDDGECVPMGPWRREVADAVSVQEATREVWLRGDDRVESGPVYARVVEPKPIGDEEDPGDPLEIDLAGPGLGVPGLFIAYRDGDYQMTVTQALATPASIREAAELLHTIARVRQEKGMARAAEEAMADVNFGSTEEVP